MGKLEKKAVLHTRRNAVREWRKRRIGEGRENFSEEKLFPPFPKTFDLIESLFTVFLTQIPFRIREFQLCWTAVRQGFRCMVGNSKQHVFMFAQRKMPEEA